MPPLLELQKAEYTAAREAYHMTPAQRHVISTLVSVRFLPLLADDELHGQGGARSTRVGLRKTYHSEEVPHSISIWAVTSE